MSNKKVISFLDKIPTPTNHQNQKQAEHSTKTAKQSIYAKMLGTHLLDPVPVPSNFSRERHGKSA